MAARRLPAGDPLSRSERIAGRADADTTRPTLTAHALDAWESAAYHLLDLGLTPAVPAEVRRALWGRGGSDRELAERLHRRCGE